MFIVEKKLCVDVMTSSPGLTPQASKASSIAPVAKVRVRVGRPPNDCDSARSNSSTRGPLAIQPERMVAARAATVSSEISGCEKLRSATVYLTEGIVAGSAAAGSGAGITRSGTSRMNAVPLSAPLSTRIVPPSRVVTMV
jgi:hypothetical protein